MKKLTTDNRCIGLIANREKISSRVLIRKAVALITASNRSVVADESTAQFAGLKVETCISASELTKRADLIMVFGGDGTMLRVAREAAGSCTPILGINVGGLGFLTDVQSRQLSEALQQIWSGKTICQTRPLIQAEGKSRGQPFSIRALNDFVMTRGAAPRLIELGVAVDGEVLTRYRCDGLIVCSPTGSTAYSLAAGGAVVSPSADVFTLTPICPHTLSNRSVVVSLSSVVQVKVLSKRVETVLTADGQPPLPLAAGDVVTIRRSRDEIRLLHLAGTSFFETLRRKLNWSGSYV